MFNMNPNALIWGARYDRMMEAFGGKGFYVEDPKDLKGALKEAMNFKGPALGQQSPQPRLRAQAAAVPLAQLTRRRITKWAAPLSARPASCG
jgi:thiamine pyrophosphate-dependent acetolactate synthase large subunit-like protein